MQLRGKQVVITGGTGGIGNALTKALRAQHAKVQVLSRDGAGDITADLSTTAGIAEAGRTIAAINPDILINLAGISYFGEFESETSDHVSAMMHVNLMAPLMLAQAVIPGMKRRKSGVIVNVGSVFGAIPFAYFASYSASKAGMRGLSDALRRELEDTGVSVVHVAPRAVRTPLNTPQVMELAKATRMAMDTPEAVAQKIMEAIIKNTPHTVIGFPEKLFVRLHGLSACMIDGGVRKNNKAAKAILKQTNL